MWPKRQKKSKSSLKLAAPCEIPACAAVRRIGMTVMSVGMNGLMAFYLDFIARFLGFVVDHFRRKSGSKNLDLRLFLEPLDDIG